jgi:hypothetical protein
MLIGLTVALPSDTPVIGSRPGEELGMPMVFRVGWAGGMPRSPAAWMIFSGPSSMPRVMSMKAVLTEFSVAVSIEIAEP